MLNLHTKQTGTFAQKICTGAGLQKTQMIIAESKRVQQVQTCTTLQIQANNRTMCANRSHNSQTRSMLMNWCTSIQQVIGMTPLRIIC